MAILLKPGVSLDGLKPAGIRLVEALDQVSQQIGHDLTITCTTTDHGPADHHTHGEAVDCRVIDLTPDQTLALYRLWAGLLGEQFLVLYEVPLAGRSILDPRLAELVYGPSNPNAPHMHGQLRNGLIYDDGRPTT